MMLQRHNSLMTYQPWGRRRGMGQDTFDLPGDEGITLGGIDQVTMPSVATVNAALAAQEGATPAAIQQATAGLPNPASPTDVAGVAYTVNPATGALQATQVPGTSSSSLPLLILLAGGVAVFLFAMD